MSSAERTYIHQNRKSLKTVAFFCTQDGSESNVFKEMESLYEKASLATLKLRKKEVKKDEYVHIVKQFIAEIQSVKNPSTNKERK